MKEIESVNVFFIWLCVLNVLVILEGILAYKDKMFSPGQMIANGYLKGISWITHAGASWSDFFIITPMCALMAATYGDQWHLWQHVSMIQIVVIVTGAFHVFWTRNKLPDCIAWGGKLTPAGYVHMLYMSIVLVIIILFYFHTVGVSQVFLIVASALIAFHVAIGNHMLASLFKPKWLPNNTLKDPGAVITTLGVCIALFFRCRYMLAH